MRLLLAVAAVLATAGAAFARPTATADLSIKWVGIANGVKPVAGQAFTIGASLVNAGPDNGAGRVNVQIPSGVRRIGGTLECKEDASVLHCDEGPFSVGDNGTGTVSFIADAPGSYTFKVFIDQLAAADPNLADDTDTLTVSVSAAPVNAGGISTTPPHPRAGTAFVVGFEVDGATVSSAKCASSVGAAQAHRTAARAACTVRTPKSAAGKVVHGSLTAVAGGHTFTRRFSVKLR